MVRADCAKVIDTATWDEPQSDKAGHRAQELLATRKRDCLREVVDSLCHSLACHEVITAEWNSPRDSKWRDKGMGSPRRKSQSFNRRRARLEPLSVGQANICGRKAFMSAPYWVVSGHVAHLLMQVPPRNIFGTTHFIMPRVQP